MKKLLEWDEDEIKANAEGLKKDIKLGLISSLPGGGMETAPGENTFVPKEVPEEAEPSETEEAPEETKTENVPEEEEEPEEIGEIPKELTGPEEQS
jgi:hypothetical protein